MQKKFFGLLLLTAFSLAMSVTTLAQRLYPTRINGAITAFTPSSCGSAGSITIAGQTLQIAPGVELAFGVNNRTRYGGDGSLNFDGFGRALPFEVIGTARQISVYLDDANVIRFVVKSDSQDPAGSNPRILVTATSVGTTGDRGFVITGILKSSSSSSVTINGLTFPVASGATINATPTTDIVLLRGTLNSSNQVTALSTDSAYRRAQLNLGLNPTIPNLTNPALPYLGGVTGRTYVPNDTNEYICDQTQGFLNFGIVTINFAPDFRLDNVPSRTVGLDLFLDQFNWAAPGTKLTNDSGAYICGTVSAFAASQNLTAPTAVSEDNQRGAINLTGGTIRIGPGERIAGQDLIVVGRNYCLFPIYNTYGEIPSAAIPGDVGYTRAFALMTGSRIEPR